MFGFGPISSAAISSISTVGGPVPFTFPVLAGMNDDPVDVLSVMSQDSVALLNIMSGTLDLLEGFTEQTITTTGTMTAAPLDESEEF